MKCTAFLTLQTLNSPTRIHEDPFFKGTDSSYWIAVAVVPAIIVTLVIMFRRIDKEVI